MQDLETTTMGIAEGTRLGRENTQSLIALEKLVSRWNASCGLDASAGYRPLKVKLGPSLRRWQELLWSGNSLHYEEVQKEMQRQMACLTRSVDIEEHFRATLALEWDAGQRLAIATAHFEFQQQQNWLDAWTIAMKRSIVTWRKGKERGSSQRKVLDAVRPNNLVCWGTVLSALCLEVGWFQQGSDVGVDRKVRGDEVAER